MKCRDNEQTYPVGEDIRLAKSGRTVLFNDIDLSTSTGRTLEKFNFDEVVSRMYKIKKTSFAEGIFYWFKGERGRRLIKITNWDNNAYPVNNRRKCYIRIYLRNTFGFV